MPAVQGDLRSLLASAEVHADVVQDLGDKGCVSVALFSNWFDKGVRVTGSKAWHVGRVHYDRIAD